MKINHTKMKRFLLLGLISSALLSCNLVSSIDGRNDDLLKIANKASDTCNIYRDLALTFTGKDDHKHDSLIILATKYFNKCDSIHSLILGRPFTPKKPAPLWENSIIDSSLYYFNKETDAHLKADNFTIKYYQTVREKYRILANKYGDSVHYWYNKLAARAK